MKRDLKMALISPTLRNGIIRKPSRMRKKDGFRRRARVRREGFRPVCGGIVINLQGRHMHSLFRVIPAAFLAFVLSACASKTDERLDTLEAQARDHHILDLRLTHIEERVTGVESAIGELREKTSAPAAGRRAAKPSTERLPASPVALGTVPAGELPAVRTMPYLPSTDPLGATPMPPPAVGVGQAPVNDPYAGPGLTTVSLEPGSPAGAKPQAVKPQAVKSQTAGPRPVKPASGASGRTGTAASPAYDAAYALYNKGEYAKAQQAFADFLAASPQSPLAPNALYWQGECQYSLGKYDGAILFFQDVINKYPKHAKAAAALLKAGYSYERLKDMENARFYWQILVDDFPKSSPAALARKRLNG